MPRSQARIEPGAASSIKDIILLDLLQGLSTKSVILGAGVGVLTFSRGPVPTRVYGNVEPTALYDHIIRMLNENNFAIISSDRDTGITIAEYDKGIVKEVLFWKWRQKYKAVSDLDISISNRNVVFLFYSFQVEEQPPLSSAYVTVEHNEDAQRTTRRLLLDLDQFVIKKGGNF
ncbi:MAG: hypothetical protein MN733_10215 [Nitrososphaera sp.]|nr:hypothetical protein [Nitrososphaera sp.]